MMAMSSRGELTNKSAKLKRVGQTRKWHPSRWRTSVSRKRNWNTKRIHECVDL